MTQAAPITDYASLTAYIIDKFDRANDTVFVGHTDVMISQAEAAWTPVILNRKMEATATLTTDANGFASLPADFYRPRGINAQINAANTYLPSIGPNAVSGMFPISTGDLAGYVQITSTGLYLQPPTASQVVTLDYWAQFVGLSASATQNWIVKAYPDLYQFSVMAQAAVFNDDLDSAAKYATIADGKLMQITDYFALDYYMNAETVLDTVTP